MKMIISSFVILLALSATMNSASARTASQNWKVCAFAGN